MYPSRSSTAHSDRAVLYSSYHQAYLAAKLSMALGKQEGFSVFSHLTLNINNESYAPQVCVYKKHKIDWLHDKDRIIEPPLLAVEVLGPTYGTRDVIDTFKSYFQAKIKSCWLVVPVTRSIVVFDSYETGTTFTQGRIKDPVLSIEIEHGEIF